MRLYDVVRRDPRYAPEAYRLCLEAVDRLGAASSGLSAQKIVLASLEQAREHYGPMARSVLNHWGIVSPGSLRAILRELRRGGVVDSPDHDPVSEWENVRDWDAVLGPERECVFENIQRNEEKEY